MPQDVFDMCAVTAARFQDADEVGIEEFARRIAERYRRDYIDDGFEVDVISAAHHLVKLMEGFFPGQKVSASLRQIQYCIKRFRPDGRKKPFFQGQWFNQQKSPLNDRVKKCVSNVAVFHLGTLSGKFPIAPEGWSL